MPGLPALHRSQGPCILPSVLVDSQNTASISKATPWYKRAPQLQPSHLHSRIPEGKGKSVGSGSCLHDGFLKGSLTLIFRLVGQSLMGAFSGKEDWDVLSLSSDCVPAKHSVQRKKERSTLQENYLSQTY